jgi:hypothetical protein
MTPTIRIRPIRVSVDLIREGFERLTGRGIGVARYVRLAHEPDSADLAVTVADDFSYDVSLTAPATVRRRNWQPVRHGLTDCAGAA